MLNFHYFLFLIVRFVIVFIRDVVVSYKILIYQSYRVIQTYIKNMYRIPFMLYFNISLTEEKVGILILFSKLC